MTTHENGLDAERLQRLVDTIQADVERERYDGAVVVVARGGRIALHEAIGFADRAQGRAARTDDVFLLYSVTKTLTSVAVLQKVDRGELSLTTPVAEVLPEFGVRGKQRVTVAQLLCHMGGLPADLPPIAPDQLTNLEAVARAVSDQSLSARPGSVVSYSPIGAHAVLAEVVRRLDGGARPFRDVLAQDVFGPLGMKETSLGLRADLAARRVPIVVRDRNPGLFPAQVLEGMSLLIGEDSEIPAGGAFSTAHDLYRWAEALRRGGELDGARILSPGLLDYAAQNHTGDLSNDIFDGMREARGWEPFPGYIGLGFFLRGEGLFPTYFGQTTSPRTFGGLGAGSTMFWIDPDRDLVFVCLTAGLLEESRNLDRMQQLSDLVVSSVVD